MWILPHHITGSIIWRPFLSLHPEDWDSIFILSTRWRNYPHFTDGTLCREEVDVQQARCRPPDLAQPQCWEPEQGVQPLTQEPSILHTGPPTEHEGEEGVITQQQHDAQHCPEAVPGCTLLQLKQPVVLGDKKTGWVGTHEMPALQSQGRWCQDYDSEQRTGLPTP